MIHYILQVVLFQLLFLVVYDLFLKKETFFNYNRLYLLLTSLVSFVLPFIKIAAIQQTIPESFRVQLPAVILGNSSAETATNSIALGEVVIAQQFFSWSQVALWIYLLGIVFSFILFGLKLRKLYLLKRIATIEKLENHTIAIVPNTDVAFTFLNTIFLGEKLSEPQRTSILQHELVHVRQRHTVDLLFFEILRILFWFNPMVYLYQQKVQALHEYTADRFVATADKAAYYQNLLSEVFGTTTISFINTFYNSSITRLKVFGYSIKFSTEDGKVKNRIVMLQKSNSKKIVQLKYLLLIPAVCAMLVYTSCSEDTTSQPENQDLAQYTYSLQMGEEMSPETKVVHEAYESFLKENNKEYVAWVSENKGVLTYSVHKRSEKVPATYEGDMKLEFADGSSYDAFMQLPKSKISEAENGIVEYEMTDKYSGDGAGVPFATIEKVPTYSECTGSNEEQKKCTSQKIATFVGNNFNKDLAKDVNLSGRQRIVVQFKIDASGNITDVSAKAAHPSLETEAVRVVSGLPQMIPGEQDGKKVSVIYALPILFEINE